MKGAALFEAGLACALAVSLAACAAKKEDPAAEAPPPAAVIHEGDLNIVKVDHPELFPLAVAAEHDAALDLKATGVVSPDVSRTVPVVSLASGRVVEIRARLGDRVTKGQLLMKVQSADISQAYSDYQQATADEILARAQLERSKVLYAKGATAQKDLEIAEDTENKAKISVQTALERLRVLGANPDHPSPVIGITAPISGVITDQQVTTAAGVQGLASPNPFTISDLSHVWILCDVYENDLSQVHLGEYADIHIDAYPNLALKGRIANIAPILDPNLRTAKVRLEVRNPGMLRLGMFVTATFHGLNRQARAMVPASAILHLHDRNWVFVPIGNGQFRRTEVVDGDMLPGNMQTIVSGLDPGRQVVSNALVLNSTVEQ